MDSVMWIPNYDLRSDMKITKQNQLYHIVLSRDELKLLGHCVLEALDALGDDEFAARVGVEAPEARELLEQIIEAKRKS